RFRKRLARVSVRPRALTRLLLGGRVRVSMKLAVNDQQTAVAGAAHRAAMAFWAWLIGAAVITLAALVFGGDPAALAGAAALRAAPGFAGFALLPHLGRDWARATLLTVWLVAAIGAAAGTGGAFSPAVTLLAAPPALACLLGVRSALPAAASVLGYA